MHIYIGGKALGIYGILVLRQLILFVDNLTRSTVIKLLFMFAIIMTRCWLRAVENLKSEE